MNKDHKPATILTGFLGAGKTTYLNYLMKSNPEKRYAIIENEYGKKGIDAELILRAEDGIVELNNGCLCCTLNDGLYDILNTLFDRRNEYDEIVIEATGLADPRGLAEPFVSHPAIKKQFPLSKIICLVDAENIEQQLLETEEAINQVTFSDILLVNKTDLLQKEEIQKVVERLKKLNPLSLVFTGNQNDFPNMDTISNHLAQDEILVNIASSNVNANENFPVDITTTHHQHKHTEGIATCSISIDQPLDYNLLHHRLMVYLTFQAKGLYRMKGILWIEGKDNKYSLQAVGKRVVFDENRPWAPAEEKKSSIVMIGKNLNKKVMEKMFKDCIVKEKTKN